MFKHSRYSSMDSSDGKDNHNHKNKAKVWNILTSSVLALILGLSTPAQALGSPIDDVRYLLENMYVEPVDSKVLSAQTVEDMLESLGDPYTDYFTEEEYEDFINSMDASFSGIGVYIEQVPRGLKITSVIEGSPAEEIGLRSGDIIIQVDGQILEGLSQEKSTALIKGPDGSFVYIVVLRGEEQLNFRVERRAIEVPTVTGEMINDDIGYVAIETFGETTEETFKQVVKKLDSQGADAWIIDLRDNPGGYLNTALSLAGFFIGDQTALKTKDRSGNFVAYLGKKQEFIINEPVIFLTNENSASASEILTAAVKDYYRAAVVGANTYGKGSVQSLYQLSDGDVLKMTVAKFYSPYGKEINGVGISPDVEILKNDPEQLAELMLEEFTQNSQSKPANYIRFNAGGRSWGISLDQARTPKYWSTYRELVQNNTLSGGFSRWKDYKWQTFTTAEQDALWPLFYPGYTEMSELSGLPLDKTFTVRFTSAVDLKSITADTIELIESETGERVPLKFESIDERSVKVIPTKPLEAKKTYWLAMHEGVVSQDGSALREGVITVIKTQ